MDSEDFVGNNNHTQGGHPVKKLRKQRFEEFEEEFMRQSKPCVQLVDKRQRAQKVPEEPANVEPGVEPLVRPIQERSMQPETSGSEGEQAAPPKKKQSLFAQRLQAKKGTKDDAPSEAAP
jgi:hypothetical protein